MMNQNSISVDLMMEISSRLPSKSVARFRCVSKLWASILGSTPYFTELFQTVSSTKPRLLFASVEDNGVWSFFSSPQLQNPYGESLLAGAEFHVKLSLPYLKIKGFKYNDLRYFSCAYASGLIYFHGKQKQGRPLVCNPNTGRLRYLPLPYRWDSNKNSLFGFEPIKKQYKVLFIAFSTGFDDHKIITLGRDKSWRKINCQPRHEVKSEGVCINGVLYYLGESVLPRKKMIVCFDVRSEKFTFIDVERFCRLIDYNGRLAVIFWEEDDTIALLHVWVQEDVEKQEWSKYVYTCSDDKFFSDRHIFAVGVTHWGEIVFAMRKHTIGQPFYVFYFSPENHTLRRVEIQGGFGERFKNLRSIRTFGNHVEDLDVNDLKLLNSVCARTKKRRKRAFPFI